MSFEHIILDLATQLTEIFDGEYSRGSRIAFRERVYLPQSGYESGEMFDYMFLRQSLIAELPLLFQVIFNGSDKVF